MNASLIYILLWTPTTNKPFSTFSSQQEFIKRNCSFTNCYVTYDRDHFGGDLTRFNAIFFDGREIWQIDVDELNRLRKKQQKFVFTNTEPSDFYPVYHKVFNNFFNWTMTYRLDSDIPIPSISVKDEKGTVVGPKQTMHWKTGFNNVNDKFGELLQRKSQAAVWFASECKSLSKREDYVKYLAEALQPYGYAVDIFGKCGNETGSDFDKDLTKDYFFYLAFEKVFAEDYVSEEVLAALRNHTVPIVFGGANYSRFLPPGSYLNARDHSPEELSFIMRQIMWNPALYEQFFHWRYQYTIEAGDSTYVCDICAALNNIAMMETETVYRKFRRWWNDKWFELV